MVRCADNFNTFRNGNGIFQKLLLLNTIPLCSTENVIIVQHYSCLETLLKGGTKPIFDIATNDFINSPKLYFTPKIAHFGLKMIIRHFSSKFWKKNLTPIFTFLVILKLPKIFFSKIFLRESYLLPGFLR